MPGVNSNELGGTAWITEAEAAELLRVSLNTLRRRRKADALPHVRLGRRVLYDRDQLDEYIRSFGQTANREVPVDGRAV